MSEQPKFLLRAKETYSYHRSKLLSNDDWTTAKTAKALRRSIGSISEDLIIARACKDNEKKIEKFKYAKDALEFIRDLKEEKEKEEID